MTQQSQLRIDQIKKQIVPVLRQAGVKRSSFFGSYARGEETKDSDVDILVELPENKSLLDLVRLQRQLGKVVGKKIDLITYNSVNPLLKDYIEKDQLQII